MNVTAQYDIIVAGAGPAGCAAALILQQAGLNVCLIDNVNSNNFKTGESIPGALVRLLRRLGIAGIESLLDQEDFKPCSANVSAWSSDQWTYKDALLNPEGGGWHVNRNRFDEALRRVAVSAGITLYAAKVVRAVKYRSEEGVNDVSYTVTLNSHIEKLQKNIHARCLIDATGRTAFLSRQLRFARHRTDHQMAAVCWLKTNEVVPDYTTRIKSVACGWWYTALLPDRTRVVNFYSLPQKIKFLLQQPDTFFRSFNDAQILPFDINESMKICFLGTDASTVKSERVGIENFICVGDAALSLDPLSAQGIYFALYSGIKGAETVILGLKNTTMNEIAISNYQLQADKVFHSVQLSRAYFYKSEYRYVNSVYWKNCINTLTI